MKNLLLSLILLLTASCIYAQDKEIASIKLIERLTSSEDNSIPIGGGAASYIMSNGDYYFVDNSSFKIYHFDKNGRLKNEFGRKGRGPGEFLEINDIYVKDEKIYVLDYNNSRIQIFKTSGDFHKTVKLPFQPFRGNEILIDHKNKIQILGYYRKQDLFVHLHDSVGNYIDSFGKFIDFSNFFMNTNGKIQLTQLHVAQDNGELFYTLGAPLKIFKYDQNYEKVWSIKDDILPEPWKEHIKVTPTSYSSRFYPSSFNSIIVDKWLLVYWINPELESRNSYLELRDKTDGQLISRFELGYSDATISLGINSDNDNSFFVLTKSREMNTFSLLNMKIQ